MIGSSIKIKGEISGDEDLLIEGKVEGTIKLSNHGVSVGQSGQVYADIRAKTIKIDGEVKGDITGDENVVISKTSNFRGNIVSPRVTLEDGGIFKGSIDMVQGDTAKSKVPVGTQQPALSPATGERVPGLDLKSG